MMSSPFDKHEVDRTAFNQLPPIKAHIAHSSSSYSGIQLLPKLKCPDLPHSPYNSPSRPIFNSSGVNESYFSGYNSYQQQRNTHYEGPSFLSGPPQTPTGTPPTSGGGSDSISSIPCMMSPSSLPPLRTLGDNHYNHFKPESDIKMNHQLPPMFGYPPAMLSPTQSSDSMETINGNPYSTGSPVRKVQKTNQYQIGLGINPESRGYDIPRFSEVYDDRVGEKPHLIQNGNFVEVDHVYRRHLLDHAFISSVRDIKRRTKTGCLTCRKRRIKVSDIL